MKKFLFFIPVLFLFVGCVMNNTFNAYVKNSTNYDIKVYYSENPETIYTVKSNETIYINRYTNGSICGQDLPDNVYLSLCDMYNYEIKERILKLYTFTVYNTFSVPIIFYYDGNQQNINPGESFTYSSYTRVFSFAYDFNGAIVQGDNDNLVITKS